jgi:glutathione peroxidase
MKLLLVFLLSITAAFAQEIYQIKEKSIDGKEFEMSSLKDKVVLIVNIASQCGYTKQLGSLESLYQKYKDKKFTIVGVPTNDFGEQTPEDDKNMMEFCQKNYNVSFPVLTKKTIQGPEKRELYKYLTEKTPKNLQGEVGWNFEKFLIDRKGRVVGRMRPSLDPMDNDMLKKIGPLL